MTYLDGSADEPGLELLVESPPAMRAAGALRQSLRHVSALLRPIETGHPYVPRTWPLRYNGL